MEPEPKPITPSSYEELFGMFKDDPTFSEFIEEVEKYRRERNTIDDPAWKQPGIKLEIPGAELSKAILEERGERS